MKLRTFHIRKETIMIGTRYIIRLSVLGSLYCLLVLSSLCWAGPREVEIVSFGVEPPFVLEGSTMSLRWQTINAKSVTISGIGEVPLSGSRTLTYSSQFNKFLLTAVSKKGVFVSRELSINRPDTSPSLKPVLQLVPRAMTPVTK